MKDRAKILIKKLLLEYDCTMVSLAEQLGTSSQNLNTKINRASLRLTDLIQICDILGLEICFRPKPEVGKFNK
jgi:hypothetical protein